MFDGAFICHFPLYAIGVRTAAALANDPALSQRYVAVDSNLHTSLCLFTERELAEEFQVREMIAGNVVEFDGPFPLVEFLLKRDPSITDVACDPNSRANKVVACPVPALLDALGKMLGLG